MLFKFVNNTISHNYPLGSIIDLTESDSNHLQAGGHVGNKCIAQISENTQYIQEGWDGYKKGNNFSRADVARVSTEDSLPTNLDSSDTKIIKKKVRTEEADKYKDNMVIVLKKDKETIYLSTTLRHTLLHESNRIGFAFDKEKNSNFIYCEFEEKEGYEVSELGEIKSAAEWRDLFNSFNQSEIYLKNKYTKDKDNPDYLFYEIQPEKDSIFKIPSRKTATKTSNRWTVDPPLHYSSSYNASAYMEDLIDPIFENTSLGKGVKENNEVAVKKSETKRSLWVEEAIKSFHEAGMVKSVQESKDKIEDLKHYNSYKLEYIDLNNDKIEIGKEVPSEEKSEKSSF